jgi:hypothetical protein
MGLRIFHIFHILLGALWRKSQRKILGPPPPEARVEPTFGPEPQSQPPRGKVLQFRPRGRRGRA